MIGRLRGDRPGPDRRAQRAPRHRPDPARRPPRIEGDLIYGRGSADMKGACACAARGRARAARSGSFAGELVIVAIGLHEAPGGRGEDLTLAARRATASPPTWPSCASSRATAGRRLAHGPGDGGDHDLAARDADARAADAEGHAASAARRGEGRRRAIAARSEELAADRAPVGRRRDLLRRRAARRRLLQPLPVDVPDRRHPPLGARATRWRPSRPSTARSSTASRPRRAARSSST